MKGSPYPGTLRTCPDDAPLYLRRVGPLGEEDDPIPSSIAGSAGTPKTPCPPEEPTDIF
jgi:hypothetical protein